MGNIRPSFIKIRALRLIERYPDHFTSDFDENKGLVERFTDVDNKKMRKWIAGYITRYNSAKSTDLTPSFMPHDGDHGPWAAAVLNPLPRGQIEFASSLSGHIMKEI